jgi:hypothetical protein
MAIIPNNPPQDSAPIGDRNKTDLTLRTTAAAAAWLHNIGAKAVESEVYVGEKWVADLAAFWQPTLTEIKRTRLLCVPESYSTSPAKMNWKDGEDYKVAMQRYLSEFSAWRKINGTLWEKALEALPTWISIVLEVKTSRADFRKDTKWKSAPMADMQVLSFSKGILQPEEIPAGWWGLMHSAETGSLLKVVRREPPRDVGINQRCRVIANIAERQHNREHNRFWNDMQRRRTLEDKIAEKTCAEHNVAAFALAIFRGESNRYGHTVFTSFEDAVERYFYGKPPKQEVLDLLRPLFHKKEN